MTARIFTFGESALVLAHDAPATLEVQRRIWSVAAQARAWKGVTDAVVGMNNVTLFLETGVAPESCAPQLEQAWANAAPAISGGRLIEIAVRYGGAYGPDLGDVARRCRRSEAEIVALHCAREYEVYFLGFQPGFAYLGDLDERLQLPRRTEPRSAVPAGSVAIAAQHTGIYPARSPGGWHVIGQTGIRLFDPLRTPPSLLAAGDRVRFIPMDAVQ